MLCVKWRSLKVLLRCIGSLWGPCCSGCVFRLQHSVAFDRHEEKPDQNSSHSAAGGHKEQPMEMSVTERAASGREPKRKRGGNGVCVCVCVWEREREREDENIIFEHYNIWTLKYNIWALKNISGWNHRHIFFSSISKDFINKRVSIGG